MGDTSFSSVRSVLLYPFYVEDSSVPAEVAALRRSLERPTVAYMIGRYTECIRRASHTTMVPFRDPTIATCGEDANRRLTAYLNWGKGEAPSESAISAYEKRCALIEQSLINSSADAASSLTYASTVLGADGAAPLSGSATTTSSSSSSSSGWKRWFGLGGGSKKELSVNNNGSNGKFTSISDSPSNSAHPPQATAAAIQSPSTSAPTLPAAPRQPTEGNFDELFTSENDNKSGAAKKLAIQQHTAAAAAHGASLVPSSKASQVLLKANAAFTSENRSDNPYAKERVIGLEAAAAAAAAASSSTVAVTSTETPSAVHHADDNNNNNTLSDRGGVLASTLLADEYYVLHSSNPSIDKAVRFVLWERLNTVDVSKTPWTPRKSYVEMLKRQGRMPEQAERIMTEIKRRYQNKEQ